jgi:hypothetical protein
MLNKEAILKSIEILVDLGKVELAFELRVFYDSHFRDKWK